MIEFKLPSLGAEMDEGTLLEWKVKPGEHVRKGDVVAVVDTSKSAIDVEIWDEGTIYELVLGVQETVPVGTVMARLLEPGETPEHAEEEKRRHVAAQAGAPTPRRRCRPRRHRSPRRPLLRRLRQPGAGSASRLRPASSPPSWAWRSRRSPAPAPTARSRGRTSSARRRPRRLRRTGWSEMRRAIAAAMARSKREIPHYYLATDIPLAAVSAGSPSATSSGR